MPAFEPGRDLARAILAGLAGTAAMTLSQMAEQRVTGRKSSNTPAQAACYLLGFKTRTEAQEHKLADRVHWAYGTTWGLGQLALRRVPEPLRTVLFFGTVWASGAAMLTAAKLSPPPTEWSADSLATDLGHHVVFAAASGLAAHALEAADTPASAAGSQLFAATQRSAFTSRLRGRGERLD